MEISTFGLEFVALCTARDVVSSQKYKLRMMGILLVGEANVFCDNETVYKSLSRPEAVLKKKHISICFHAVREAVAMRMLCVGFVKGINNLADYLTKLMSGLKKRELVGRFLY